MARSSSVGPRTGSDPSAKGSQPRMMITTSPRKGKSFIGDTAPLGAPQRIARISPNTVQKEIHQRAPQFHKR